jgi:integrase
MKTLTIKEIENLKPRDKEYIQPDSKRLFIRVRPDGSRAWLFIYQWQGKRVKMALNGDSVPAIRSQAACFNDWLDIGIKQPDGSYLKTSPKHKLEADEQQAKAEQEAERVRLERERLEAASRLTVRQLFDRWERLGLAERKNVKEVRRMFEKDVLPQIGHLIVEDIRKAHIVQIINDVQSRGVKRMVKLMLSQVRQMFRFAVDQDIIENDPTASIRKDKIGGRDTVRDRVLSENEIKALYELLPKSGLSRYAQAAVLIMLATCCRVGELLAAEWSHLDFEAGTWTIPPENAKNGKKHTVHLSAFAASQFHAMEALQQSERWIFPNTIGTGPVCNKTLAKQIGDRQQALRDRPAMSNRSKQTDSLVLSGGKWTPHDLRRTGATLMGMLNVRPDVIEKCLNHIEQNKIVRVYQHQTLIPEQQAAWKLLGERLELLTSQQANVITLPKRA